MCIRDRCGADFTVGYSPERINPGDKVHTLETIKKIVSGSDAPTLDLLAELYGTVVRAGIHRAPVSYTHLDVYKRQCR